jgi:FixJ family two-component response regulator
VAATHSTAKAVSIVDDDEAVRLAVSSLVRSFGWKAFVFESAEAFLSSDKLDETACLISDIRMPGMSGAEMLDRVQESGYAPPTIFITAYPTAAAELKAQSSGALAILQKPFDESAISDLLTLALGSP